jgi:hypothetical protein
MSHCGVYRIVEENYKWQIVSLTTCFPLITRYVQIMEEDGMEISQPALDPASVDIHHGITVRRPKNRSHKYVGSHHLILLTYTLLLCQPFSLGRVFGA